jgi:hypothetical protein
LNNEDSINGLGPLDDSKIVAMLMEGIDQSTGLSSSRLSREREKVAAYNDGERPHALHEGNSKYTTLDVYDSVESLKAQLLEVFSGNGRPVTFPPLNPQDVQAAQIATDYCTHVIFQENRGYFVLQDAIEDSLLARVGVVKVYWESRKEKVSEEMSGMALEELEAYLQQNPEAEIEEMEESPDGLSLQRVLLTTMKDVSQVRIENLPPEQFGISAMAPSLREADLVWHRKMRTISELLKEGYDKNKVLDLHDDTREVLDMNPELVQRFRDTDDMTGIRWTGGQQSQRRIAVHECYCNLDMDGTGESRLYKVTLAGTTILDKEPVSHKPFAVFVALPKSHTFWGRNFGKNVIHTQNARTMLTRAILDHTMITTNPRLGVVKGSVLNPRELMENRIGGIVNLTKAGGIEPIPTAPLNPFVFQTSTMLSAEKEKVTGISDLSQGLNKDAISKQNSADMMDQMISVSQIRQKIIARNFANGFLTDLYRLVYDLVVANEDRQKVVQVAGNWVEVDPAGWPDRSKMEVAMCLGYGEEDKELMKWMNLDKYLSSDPQLKLAYPPQKRFNVVQKAMSHMGIKDITTYILTPDQVQPPPPDPMMQADLAVKQADAQVKLANARAAEQNVQLEMQKQAAESQLQQAKLQLEELKVRAQIQEAQDKLAHAVAIDAAELQLQKQAAAQAKLTASAEPTL